MNCADVEAASLMRCCRGRSVSLREALCSTLRRSTLGRLLFMAPIQIHGLSRNHFYTKMLLAHFLDFSKKLLGF